MFTEQNIPICVSVEGLLKRMENGRRRRKTPLAFRAVAEEVHALLPGLLRPAVAWTLTEKQRLSGGVARLRELHSSREGVLNVGERSHFLEPAREVVLAVKTIGPCLEEEVRRLESEDPLKSYVLDMAGVMAVDQVSDWFRLKVQDLAREKSWGVSPSLLPGSLAGWPVEGQGEICHFLDLEKIGVALNRFFVLQPHKSDSVAIGLGPGYTDQVVASLCGDCHRKASCPWRR